MQFKIGIRLDCAEILNRLFTKKCITWTEILSVSFLMYVIFHITPGLFLLKIRVYNTLLYLNEGGGNTAARTSTSLPSPLCKNHKKTLRSIRKLKSTWHFYIDWGLCIFLVQILKTISILFINSELVRTLYSVGLLSNL